MITVLVLASSPLDQGQLHFGKELKVIKHSLDGANIHPKRAAVAFDVTAETMLKYYTATEKKKTSDEVLGSLADDLMPKPE